MPFTKAEVEARVLAEIKDVFDLAPRYFDLGGAGLGVDSGILELSGLLNLDMIDADQTDASISFSLSSSDKAAYINAGSGVTDSGANVVYLTSGTNVLSIGSGVQGLDNETFTVTVTGIVSVNMGSTTAVTTIKFDIVLFKYSS
jgi:hypothetical protein